MRSPQERAYAAAKWAQVWTAISLVSSAVALVALVWRAVR